MGEAVELLPNFGALLSPPGEVSMSELKPGSENPGTIGPAEPDSGHLQSPTEKSETHLPDSKNEAKSLPGRKAGGPRTSAGKRRSSQNSLKHGIFQKTATLDGESRKRFDSLVKRLWNHYHPVGDLEEFYVEQAATIMWRLPRVHLAENAEVVRAQELQEWIRKQQQLTEAENQARRTTGKCGIFKNPLLEAPTAEDEGLIWHMENLEITDSCCEWLRTLQGRFKDQGFCSEVEGILKRLYGQRGQNHLHETLFDMYQKEASTSNTSRERKTTFLLVIDAEMERVKRLRDELLAFEVRRVEIEKDRQLVPDSPGFGRLMRYETGLMRQLERTLVQLEHLQRMRLGQPVPPPLKVDVSKS